MFIHVFLYLFTERERCVIARGDLNIVRERPPLQTSQTVCEQPLYIYIAMYIYIYIYTYA